MTNQFSFIRYGITIIYGIVNLIVSAITYDKVVDEQSLILTNCDIYLSCMSDHYVSGNCTAFQRDDIRLLRLMLIGCVLILFLGFINVPKDKSKKILFCCLILISIINFILGLIMFIINYNARLDWEKIGDCVELVGMSRVSISVLDFTLSGFLYSTISSLLSICV